MIRRTQMFGQGPSISGSNSKHVVEATGSFGAPRSCTDETYERVTHLMFNLSLEVKLRLSLSPALSRPITKMGEIIQILRFGFVAIYAKPLSNKNKSVTAERSLMHVQNAKPI